MPGSRLRILAAPSNSWSIAPKIDPLAAISLLLASPQFAGACNRRRRGERRRVETGQRTVAPVAQSSEVALATLGQELRDGHRLLVNRVNESVGPVAELMVRMDRAETDLMAIAADVKAVTARSAFISGGIAMIGFVASLFKWRN